MMLLDFIIRKSNLTLAFFITIPNLGIITVLPSFGIVKSVVAQENGMFLFI